MREILFKAKRKDSEEWVQGFYMECHMSGSDGADSCIVKLNGQLIVVDRDTICQFTGLYDGTKWEDLTEEEKQAFYEEVCSEDGKSIKYQNVEDVKQLWKGKKIWENDVVKFEDVGEEGYEYKEGFDFTNRARVEFAEGRWSLTDFAEENSAIVDEMYNHAEFMELWKYCQVIGTTFDNPELLGG